MAGLFFPKLTKFAYAHPATTKAFLSLLFFFTSLYLLINNPETNLAIFRSINGLSPQIADWLQLLLTDLGNGLTLGVLMLCCLIKRPELIIRVLIASILSLILVPLLKQFFDAPRPAAVLEMLHIVGDKRLSHSFPSGHSTSAFLFAGTLFLTCQYYRYKLIFILGAILVALSRITVGAHWPIDVVMGAIVGLSCAYLASVFPLVQVSGKVRTSTLATLLVILIACELSENSSQLIWPVILMRWSLIGIATLMLLQQHKSVIVQREFCVSKARQRVKNMVELGSRSLTQHRKR
ncbi:phosphatase PAP2 family protein [Shewanella mesophila]|uniref:phosphatase PAP2 family protein n=1 Tax=Shewanella mesophila TaxID=2864208 RepID=UPI001C657108|nr:phosphatase PAP2 family protein [Shewanella mesophila]QYJ86237.1 phosphatase PAP2 family protein [Shewanella mesophila]